MVSVQETTIDTTKDGKDMVLLIRPEIMHNEGVDAAILFAEKIREITKDKLVVLHSYGPKKYLFPPGSFYEFNEEHLDAYDILSEVCSSLSNLSSGLLDFREFCETTFPEFVIRNRVRSMRIICPNQLGGAAFSIIAYHSEFGSWKKVDGVKTGISLKKRVELEKYDFIYDVTLKVKREH